MKKLLLVVISVILLAAFSIFWWIQRNQSPGQYDAFALCLTEKNATFYGAFWCPHCQTQKKLFGKSEKLLPYVECSTPDGRNQTRFCQEKNIEGYPTWEFADDSRLTGEVSLENLAEKTGCELIRGE